MISKKEVSETLALSCVESYFLAWLGKYYDISKLYGNSFVSVKQVFDDFSYGASYENYEFIPRLQHWAEEYGVVAHVYKNCAGQEALTYLKNQADDELWLVRVNTAFFAGYKRAAWREDHYICVDKNLNWINQYPLSEGVFNESHFLEVYDAALCCYKVKDSCLDMPDQVRGQYCNQDFEISSLPKDLGALESAIGVLRISRKRLEKYYEKNPLVAKLLREENMCLDKLYFHMHFQSLKGDLQGEKDRIKIYSLIYQAIEKTIALEKEIAKVLKI